VGAALFHVDDRQTERTKLIVAFRNLANTPETDKITDEKLEKYKSATSYDFRFQGLCFKNTRHTNMQIYRKPAASFYRLHPNANAYTLEHSVCVCAYACACVHVRM
jgi:hypothetical protein